MLTQEADMHEGSITIRLPVDLKEIERLNRIVRRHTRGQADQDDGHGARKSHRGQV